MAQDDLNNVIQEERWALLAAITDFLDKPMVVLSFLWLALVIVDFTVGLTIPLVWATNIIWAVFILDFLLELWVAPDRSNYLKHNWLTAISIVLPAFRILYLFRVIRALGALRVLQASTAVRTVGLLRLLTSTRRGIHAVSLTLKRRKFGYIFIITLIVLFAGAAGMSYFENSQSLRAAGYPDETGLRSYGDAVWWTAMILTTIGSEYWPKTPEGRCLGFLISVYAITVFGYITATLASYFIHVDTEAPTQPPENE